MIGRRGFITGLVRDWWRGWSDGDLENALLKVKSSKCLPGGMIRMSQSEMRAYFDFYRDRLRSRQ